MLNILVVDDDPISLQIIQDFLSDQNYQLHLVNDSTEAWNLLEQSNNRFDAIILDRIMPGLNGIELLQRIKQKPELDLVPVIMQTEATNAQQVAEGMAAGAWYYLAKPYEKNTLIAIVASALEDYRVKTDLKKLTLEIDDLLFMTTRGTFQFKTPEQARELATLLAKKCHNPEAVSMGLTELMLNAIEHGNLGINYLEKGILLEENQLETEIRQRLKDPQYADRFAEISLTAETDHIRFTLRDMGRGFQWKNYLDFDPNRAFHTHGRGIALARQLAFNSLTYLGLGNIVTMTTPAK